MKKIYYLMSIALMAMTSLHLSSCSNDDETDNNIEEVTIHVENHGTLTDLLGADLKKIKTLTITGEIDNSNDIKTLKNMSKLSYLDLTDCHIVADTDFWGEEQDNILGSSAFEGLTTLMGIKLPRTLTSIGSYAFNGCESLSSITIPSSVTYIGGSAFQDCTKLIDVTIPADVTSIESYLFSGCSSLSSITIPENVTSIENCAFQNCSSLTSINIPASVTSIDATLLFLGCSSLKSFTVDENNRIYSSDGFALFNKNKTTLFYLCSNVTSYKIPNSVRDIYEFAFSYNTSLTTVDIPTSVKSIGHLAFMDCSNLISLFIPSSVESITRMCMGCVSLDTFTVDEDNKNYSSDGVALFNKEKTTLIELCANVASYKIPMGVNVIGEFAFAASLSGLEQNLTSIEIPSTVKMISDYAFSRCSNLTTVNIPSSVEEIGEQAFSDCESLTSIVIPASVKSLGEGAFSWCDNLTSVYMEASIPPHTTYESSNSPFYYTENAVLYVPKGCKTNYLSWNGWFKEIKEY